MRSKGKSKSYWVNCKKNKKPCRATESQEELMIFSFKDKELQAISISL
jgi:hypothetical protein